MNKKVTTTNITYKYDDCDGKMVGKTIVETEEDYVPSVTTAATMSIPDDDYEVETGVEMDGIIETSPLEVLLTAAIGALLGNLLYHAIRQD